MAHATNTDPLYQMVDEKSNGANSDHKGSNNGKTGKDDSNAKKLVNKTSDDASSHRRSEESRVGKECRSRWSPYH